MTQAITTVGEIHRPPLPGESPPRPVATPAPNASTLSLPETRAAARQNVETAGRFQVHIHAETMRIITEMVDMATGDVVMYFPPGYRPNAKPPESNADKEPAEAGK
jgi:hypothetical protein